MATYLEIRSLFNSGDLLNKVEVACLVAAETIRNELVSVENHANRLIWAKRAFVSPQVVRDQMLMALLAANAGADLSVITSAPDTTIQANVDAAVDVFSDGS